jgi:hypothetical protein
MAKYRFQCEKCSTVFERYTSANTENLPCKECKANAKRLLPTIGSQQVTEIIDPFLNIRHGEDHRKQLENRRIEHFWDVEVPRLIQTYSTQTCLEEGWLVYNEKGELVIGKPQKKSK